ncbi:MAG: hypothetical protein KDD53_07375, partial [Bdellovibrionales bacterium]|nr:hypothetical protein [Bdellovibrionales bacterium]
MSVDFKSRQSERGIIIPLAAIVTVVIGAILIAFGIDHKRGLEAKAAAQLKADVLCSYGSRSLPIARNAIGRMLNLYPLGDTNTSTDPIDINSYLRIIKLRILVPTPEITIGSGSPFLSGGPYQPSSFGFANCPGNSCEISGDVSDPAISANYPAGFLKVEDANRYVSCEVTSEYDTFLSGTRSALGKATYQQKVIDASSSPSRGVIIGIAPQAEIYADTPDRYAFQSGDAFDPTVGPVPMFQWARDNPAAYPELNFEPFAQSPAISSLAKRVDRIRHCQNVFISARNVILQSLVGRLARSGETRDKTRILLLNPKHRVSNPPPNPPTLIVERSEDLMATNYRLPLINYRPNGNEKGDITSLGYLCPFSTECGAGISIPDQRHHVLVTNQLTDCFYLNAQNGVSTYQDLAIQNYDVNWGGIQFEPQAFVAQNQMPLNYNATVNDWAQPPNFGHSAEEIVRKLGVVSSCPMDFTGLTNVALHDCSGHVNLPDPATYDPNVNHPARLLGDIVGFLQYVLQINGAFFKQGPVEIASATGSLQPGLVVNSDNLSDLSQIFLLVSKPLDPTGEIERDAINLL